MTLKRKGEVGLEEIYASAPKGVTYTIVRPGGLTDGGVIGPAGGCCLCLCLNFSTRSHEYMCTRKTSGLKDYVSAIACSFLDKN